MAFFDTLIKTLKDPLHSEIAPWNQAKKLTTAPFDKREGQPWLQSFARNVGEASFGPSVAEYVNTRFLGDAPSQQQQIGKPMKLPPPDQSAMPQPATNWLDLLAQMKR